MARDGAIRFGYGVNGNAVIAAGSEEIASGGSVPSIEPVTTAVDTMDGEDKQGYIAWEYYLYGQAGARSGQVRVAWQDNGQVPAYSHSATGDTHGDTHLVTVNVGTDGLGAVNFNVVNETTYQWNIIWHRVDQLRDYEYIWPNLEGPSLLLRIQGLETAGKSWFTYTGDDELIGVRAEQYIHYDYAPNPGPGFAVEYGEWPRETTILTPEVQSGGAMVLGAVPYPITPYNPAAPPTVGILAVIQMVFGTTYTVWETERNYFYPASLGPYPSLVMTPISPGFLLDGNVLTGSITLNGVTFSWQRHPGDLPGEWHNYQELLWVN